ncbi:MAG: hypothetical protein AAGF22_09495 [Pseudomonadota bacterium]
MITEDDLQGHWQRDWIKAQGFEDHQTRVNWMQAGALFADLRIPLDRPSIAGRADLSDLTQGELAQLMTAEGFAGHITVADSRCTWHREINWHGVPDADDIGLMSHEGGALMEDGVLADYRERWSPQPSGALRGHRLTLGTQTGILIESDETFLLALGPHPTGTSSALRVALAMGTATPAAINAHFASSYSLGRWDGADGIAELSTNPFNEGQRVLTKGATPGVVLIHAPSAKRTVEAHIV